MVTKEQQKELRRITQEVIDLKSHEGDHEVIHYKYDQLVQEALILLGGGIVIEAMDKLCEAIDVQFWYA